MDTKYDKKQLVEFLKTWFEISNLHKTHLWNRDPVAKLIKTNLIAAGKWKRRARGDARKGYLKMLAAKKQDDGVLDF